jgi:D-alanyl-D-alanine carboxypeptidase
MHCRRSAALVVVSALVVCCLGAGANSATPSVASQAPAIAKAVRDLTKQYSLDAAIYGVWRNGKAVATGALGTASPGVTATVADHFRIGNTTEAIGTTLLLQLVDQRKISLDDKLSRWYPSLPHADEITVRMLASSTSGYVHYVNESSFLDAFHADVFATWTPDEIIPYGVNPPLEFAPGASWAFSDTNFVLLGEILAKVGGKPVSQQIQQRILGPLDMRDTQMTSTAEIPSPVLHGYTGERGVWEDATFWSPSWAPYTGNMTSTLSDLEKWATALGTGSLLSKRSRAQQVAPETVGLGPLTDRFFYGLGVGVSNGWVFSAPGLLGYTGVVASLPKTKTAVVVFTTTGPNSPSGTHYAGAIFAALAKIVAPASPPTFPGA